MPPMQSWHGISVGSQLSIMEPPPGATAPVLTSRQIHPQATCMGTTSNMLSALCAALLRRSVAGTRQLAHHPHIPTVRYPPSAIQRPGSPTAAHAFGAWDGATSNRYYKLPGLSGSSIRSFPAIPSRGVDAFPLCAARRRAVLATSVINPLFSVPDHHAKPSSVTSWSFVQSPPPSCFATLTAVSSRPPHLQLDHLQTRAIATRRAAMTSERLASISALEKLRSGKHRWLEEPISLPGGDARGDTRGDAHGGDAGGDGRTGSPAVATPGRRLQRQGCACPCAAKRESTFACAGLPTVHPVDVEAGNNEDGPVDVAALGKCEHKHYSHRAPWLRALVLGANDGLVSIASLMLGVGAVDQNNVKTMVVGGLAGLVAGACSMAIGEFVSVYSQRDAEKADVDKERQEHAKGPEAVLRELEELTQIYVARGLSYSLAKQVAKELSAVDPIKAHARDELGIDMDDYSNPGQAALASAVAFASGASIPLLAGGFISDFHWRLAAVIVSTSLALALFGAIGARLGGAPAPRAAVRVLAGGGLAMAVTFGVLKLFGLAGVSG